MALKPDRKILNNGTDVHWYLNETATRGCILTHLTGGSGAAMDDDNAVVQVATSTGETPVGLLLNDMVNLDLTRQHLNYYKDEMQLGGKVTVLTHGWVVTNSILGSATPSAGDKAYFLATGLLTNVQPGTQASIGKWLSSKDEDGYAKVEINIP